ncbi:MAG: ribokinase [Anaerolineae bacterium]|nr:ribokinase [Anaerolineae bacterium]
MARVVVVGSFNVDLTAYMSRLPLPGETVQGREFVTGPGGKGSNQAVAAARLGADVSFIGRVGVDSFGEMGLQIWSKEGINTTHVVRDPQVATGVAPIWVDDGGENSIVVVLGANLALSTADIDAAESAIASADVLLTQLEVRQEAARHALELARRHHVKTILNPAPADVLDKSMIALADYLTPNQSELQTLFGVQEGDLESVPLNDGQTLVLTAGGDGAYWRCADGSGGHQPIFPMDVVDTTGAGDAFNAGLAVALAEGHALPQAVAFASATAALCVTRPGTANSMPQRAEVDALLAGR